MITVLSNLVAELKLKKDNPVFRLLCTFSAPQQIPKSCPSMAVIFNAVCLRLLPSLPLCCSPWFTRAVSSTGMYFRFISFLSRDYSYEKEKRALALLLADRHHPAQIFFIITDCMELNLFLCLVFPYRHLFAECSWDVKFSVVKEQKIFK